MCNCETLSKEKETKKVCKDCGTINYDGVGYCQDCGAMLNDYKYVFCEICGTKNSVKNKVCDECHIIL